MQRFEPDEIEKIVKIQSLFRGALTRKQYQIHQLADHELANYGTFVVGNDPQMPKELDRFAEPDEKIALVATSGMRAVSLACKLGNPKQLPKIILVDNSQQVTAFWQAMRDFMQDDSKSGTKDLFMKNLQFFLDRHNHLYRDIPPTSFKDDCTDKIKYLSQDIHGFFKALISKYGYDYVRGVISHASVIKQSWADADTFLKIKNITSYLGITKVFMYPSNIVACIDDTSVQDQILRNIETVSPTLAIHTDVCETHCHPERVLLVTNQEPSAARSALFQPCLNPSNPGHHASHNTLTLNELMYLLAAMQSSSGKSNNPFNGITGSF